MAEEREGGRLLGLFDRAEGRITKLIALAGAITALCWAIINIIPVLKVVALPIAGIAAVVVWLVLLHVNRRKRRSTLDPDQPIYVYGKRQRLAALAGMAAMMAAVLILGGLLAYPICFPPVPSQVQCPPVIVTITKFSKGEADLAQSIQTDLFRFLDEQKKGGKKLEPKRTEVVLNDDREAKTFGNSLEGNGHLVIWGDIASLNSIWAYVTLAKKCSLAGRSEARTGTATSADSTNDPFTFYFGAADPQKNIGRELSDFAQFVTGVALYEQGDFEEATEVLKSVRARFGRFFEGLARQDLSRRSDQIANLRGAIKAYGEFVGPKWTFQVEHDETLNQKYKASAIAACINASNAYVELSDLELGGQVSNEDEAGRREQIANEHLERAFNGYLLAIDLYDELLEKDGTTLKSNLRIAEFDLAVTKAKLAAVSDQDLKIRWLKDAEKDLNDILGRLGEEQDVGSEHWQRVKASLGAVCIELSRVEPNRKERLLQAKEVLGEAFDALVKTEVFENDEQNSYERTILQANLGTAFTELAMDEPSADLALDYLKRAEEQYESANNLFSKDPAYSADLADNLSDLGLVFAERARWVESGEAETLLRKADENHTKALAFCCKDSETLKSALLSNRLARAKGELGRRLGDPELLQASIRLSERTLHILHLGPYRAMAQRNLGDSYYELGVVAGKMGHVNQATTAYRRSTHAYRQALMIWTQANAYYDWSYTQGRLRKALGALYGISGGGS